MPAMFCLTPSDVQCSVDGMITANYQNGRRAAVGDTIIEYRNGFVRCVQVAEIQEKPSDSGGDIKIRIRDVEVVDGKVSVTSDLIPAWSAAHIEDASAVFFRTSHVTQSHGSLVGRLAFGPMLAGKKEK